MGGFQERIICEDKRHTYLAGQPEVVNVESLMRRLLIDHHLDCASRHCEASRVPRFPERERLEAEYRKELEEKGLV
jgi:hypothetical protein